MTSHDQNNGFPLAPPLESISHHSNKICAAAFSKEYMFAFLRPQYLGVLESDTDLLDPCITEGPTRVCTKAKLERAGQVLLIGMTCCRFIFLPRFLKTSIYTSHNGFIFLNNPELVFFKKLLLFTSNFGK